MLLRRIARPLIAGIFISGGVAELRDLEGQEKLAAPVLDKVTGAMPIEQPPSNLTLVKVDAGVKIGAGALLALGKAPRLAAAALAASLVPTTLFEHRFWEIDDPRERKAQQVHFLKNLGLLGGLMLASADTHGKPSLAWRARRARRTSQATAQLLHRDITEGVDEWSRRAGELGDQVTSAAGRAGEQASGAAARLTEQVGEAAERYGPRATELAQRYGEQATEVAQRYGGQAAEVAGRAGERLAGHSERLLDEASTWREEAENLRGRAAKRARKAGKKAGKRAAKQRGEANRRADVLRAKAAEVVAP